MSTVFTVVCVPFPFPNLFSSIIVTDFSSLPFRTLLKESLLSILDLKLPDSSYWSYLFWTSLFSRLTHFIPFYGRHRARKLPYEGRSRRGRSGCTGVSQVSRPPLTCLLLRYPRKIRPKPLSYTPFFFLTRISRFGEDHSDDSP